MATNYRVYSNKGTGGPVDYTTPVATAAGLTYVTGPLGPSTDTTFVVRASDPRSGLEEAGTEARVRVVVGPDGRDVSGLPGPPHALTLSPASGGGCRLTWAHAPAASSGVPVGFLAYLAAGGPPDYTSPAATVPYAPGRLGYSCLLPGPFPFGAYSAAVRSFNAAGTEANTGVVPGTLGLSTASYLLEFVNVIN